MVPSRPPKFEYESLSTTRHGCTRSRIWYLVGLGITVTCLVLYKPMQELRIQPVVSLGETIPTLLSLRGENKSLISAKMNPLYQRMKTVEIYDDTTTDFDIVDVQQTIMTIQDESSRLPVSCWDLSFLQHHVGEASHGQDDDLLAALICADSMQAMERHAFKSHQMYEVATLSTLEHTAKHSSNCKDSPWSLPAPTAIRVPYCQWILLQQDRRVRGGGRWHIRARSNTLEMATAPLNVHVAYTSDPKELVVQFSSVIAGTPIVDYGADKIKGTTTSYSATDLCQAPANETGPGQFQSPGYLHTVRLTNLPVNQEVTYRVGLETGQGVSWRDYQKTRTNMKAGDDTEPYTYVVYGDQGCPIQGWDVAEAWVDAMIQRETTVRSIHHFGDLSYAEGVAHQWEAWLSMIEPAASRWPLMVSVGNHEYDYLLDSSVKDPSGAQSSYHPVWGNFGLDSAGECAVPVVKRFQMPSTGNSVFWYSYDSGLVHTVVLSSEHDLGTHTEQHKWLRNDLSMVNRTLTPWVVVELHRPLYEDEAYWAQNDVGIGMRHEVENMLVDYQVDLVLAGHYHAYHRT